MQICLLMVIVNWCLHLRRKMGVALAQGGLDQDAVTKGVLDIREGTEEAFRSRR